MKTKISTVFICIALSLTLSGCGALPSKTTIPNLTDPEASGVIASPIEQQTEAPETVAPPTEQPTETPEINTPPVDHPTEIPSETEDPEGQQTSALPAQATADTLLRSTTNGLNVRKGAGTSYASIGTLDKGDMVMPISRSGGWYEIWYMGASAYVSATYLTEATFQKANDHVEQVISEGKKLLGIPYVYGAQRYHFGNGSLNRAYDGKSYDCSSLMQYIFKIGANINIAMTSRDQSLQGREIARSDIRRGDMLFFTNASRFNKTGPERIGHVALYLGDNIILHTASDHAVIEPISDVRSSYYISARRLID